MKERVVEVDVIKGKERGELKLRFMDVGKWSGKEAITPEVSSRLSRSMGSFTQAQQMQQLQDMQQMQSSQGAAVGADARNFARIGAEFEKMKNDRAEGNYSNTKAERGKRGAAVAMGRAKIREKSGGGLIVYPMGHSRALGVGGGVGGGNNGFDKVQKIGNGMLDSLQGDRRDFF